MRNSIEPPRVAALLAQRVSAIGAVGCTARPTEDLDFFTAPERGHVPAARDALEEAARERGWSIERIHDSDTFCRMVLRSDRETLLVDLAVNSPPDLPPSVTAVGSTLAPEELAGQRLLALFDRAAARDFADVYVLAGRLGKDILLARAAQIDAGFDRPRARSSPGTHPRRARPERRAPASPAAVSGQVTGC